MFPQFKRINNESGVVLFIVLMTAIIIMLYSVSILSQSANEVNYAQQQIDQISADQVTKGIFWKAYASGSPGLNTAFLQGVVATAPSIVLAAGATGRVYSSTVTNPVNLGANPSISYTTVSTNFDTFQ